MTRKAHWGVVSHKFFNSGNDVIFWKCTYLELCVIFSPMFPGLCTGLWVHKSSMNAMCASMVKGSSWSWSTALCQRLSLESRTRAAFWTASYWLRHDLVIQGSLVCSGNPKGWRHPLGLNNHLKHAGHPILLKRFAFAGFCGVYSFYSDSWLVCDSSFEWRQCSELTL